LLCPTRRILFCQDSVAWTIGARRGGRGISFGMDALAAPVTISSAGSADAGSRALSAADIGNTAAPVFRPVFMKRRRLSIGTPLVFSAKEV
jgi:hypothetical protein